MEMYLPMTKVRQIKCVSPALYKLKLNIFIGSFSFNQVYLTIFFIKIINVQLIKKNIKIGFSSKNECDK